MISLMDFYCVKRASEEQLPRYTTRYESKPACMQPLEHGWLGHVAHVYKSFRDHMYAVQEPERLEVLVVGRGFFCTSSPS